jgi:hypothetical protein
MTVRSSKLSRYVLDPLLGLLLTALILAGLEAILWSLDLGELEIRSSLSRGFDPNAAYIVPDPEVEGGWQTLFNSRGRKEIKIAPSSGRIRILTFGGSNTAGFPLVTMRKRLQRNSPGNAYEAYNLGRQGYGSGRVRLILEQAVEKLDPQVVVIYSGHNEFIEKGFEMDLEEVGLGDWSSLPRELAAKTRMFQAVFDHYSEEYVSPQTQPEAWKSEYNKFVHLTYDETLVFFEVYEANLRAMCRVAQEHGVEVMLCTIVYNRLAMPFSSTFPRSMSHEDIERFEVLHEEAVALIPSYLDPLLSSAETERLQNRDWGPNGVGNNVGKDVLESARPCTGILAGRDPMLEKEETWTPKVRRLDRCLKHFFNRLLGGTPRAEVERAEELLGRALELCPDHPRALFELAVVEHLLGRDQHLVLEHFEQAASADRAPRKGSEAINNIIRKVAADTPGVDLFDIDRIFQDCHPGGLVSYDWMVDYCHLNFGGRWIVMEMLSDRICELWPPEHFRK